MAKPVGYVSAGALNNLFGYISGTTTSTAVPYIIPIDYLVVGGGGGGGRDIGGGGGAGGFRTATNYPIITDTIYTISVGGGGSAAASTSVRGTNGSDSTFGSITSLGGGGGGSRWNSGVGTGANGGSGGGAGYIDGASQSGGTGTAGQGNNGGGSLSQSPAGGGGGASAAGASGGSGSTSAAGNGGAGTASSITGTSVTYAGGGGGGAYSGASGTGGAGGGGNGGTNAGTANTGGGGGGGTGAGIVGGAGGSGVIVIAYSSVYADLEIVGSLTYTLDTTTRAGYKVYKFTAGSGTIKHPTNPVLGAYESIATVSVGAGGQTTLTFSSIPQTFKHLQIRSIARSNTGGGGSDTQAVMRFNSDSGANYTYHILSGSGSAAAASGGISQTNATAGFVAGSAATANCFSVAVCDILDYTNTNKFKTVRLAGGDDFNNTNSNVYFWSNVWRSTSAITQIDITNGGNYAQYSHFALYGIKG